MSNIVPTVVIGVGGTGKAAIYDIRSRVISKFGSLDHLKVINFLSLDTDFNEPDMTDENLLAEAVKLSANEQIYLKVPKTKMDEIKRDLNKHFPYYESWLESEALIKPHISTGAGQIRQLGKLSFYENLDNIVTALNTMASASTSDSSMKSTVNNGHVVQQGSLYIYVIGSLIGGTGAGLFIDMGYLIEKVLVKSGYLGGINVSHIGIFVLPLGGLKIGETVDTRASAYAALMELNHYSDDETIFEVTAPNNSRITSGAPPYKYTYLVSSQNDTQSLNKHKVVQMIGQRVFMESTSTFSPQIRSNRDNLDKLLISDDAKGCNQNYCTFGLSTVEVPVQAVINSCAAMFLRDVFLELKEGKYRGETDKLVIDRNFVVQKLASHNMGENEIKKFLGELEGGISIASFINNSIDQVDTIPASGLIKSLTQLEQDLENRFIMKKGEGGAEGAFVKQVRTNYESFVQKSEGLLAALISDLSNDQECRIIYASKFFTSMKLYYKEIYEKYLRENEGLKQNLERGKKAFDRCKNGARDIIVDWLLLFWRGPVTKDYLNRVYKNIAKRYLGLRNQYLINHYLLQILEDINKTIDKIEKKLDSFTIYIDGIKDEYIKLINIAKVSFVAINGEHIYPMENTALGLDDFVDETYKNTVGSDIEKRKLINTFYSTHIFPLIQDSQGGRHDIFRLQKDQADKDDMKSRLYDKAKDLIGARGKLQEIDVVKMFFNHYESPDVKFAQLHSLSNPFLVLNKGSAFYDSNPGKNQHRVGFYSALNPQEEHHKKFTTLSSTKIPNFDVTEGLGDIEEKYQVIFYQEYGAFPIRIWSQLEALKERYEHHLKTLNIPIHNEKKGFSFIPIDKASRKDVEELEKIFLIANIPGISVFKVTRTKKGTLYQLDYFEGTIKRSLELRGEIKDIPYQLIDRKGEVKAIKDEIFSVRDEVGDEKFAAHIINYLNNDLRTIYSSEDQKELRARYARLIEEYLKEEDLKDIADDLTHEALDSLRKKEEAEPLKDLKKEEISIKAEDLKKKTCPKCNVLLSSDTVFCSKCGYKFEIKEEKEKVCPGCQTSLASDVMFCSKCGYKFEKKEEKEKLCPGCSTTLASDAMFCSRCGYKFEKKEETEKICPGCSTTLAFDAIFCSKCGYRFAKEEAEDKEEESRFCSSCGEKISASDIFCSKCGYKFTILLQKCGETIAL